MAQPATDTTRSKKTADAEAARIRARAVPAQPRRASGGRDRGRRWAWTWCWSTPPAARCGGWCPRPARRCASASALARQPGTVASRAGEFAREIGKVAVGSSELAPGKKDKRFADPAWTGNPLLRRAMQAHLATARTAWELIEDADLEWQDDERIRFTATNLVDALAPSNVPVLNPLSVKAALDTGGASVVRGLRRFLRDLTSPPRVPSMVDPDAFTVGEDLAAHAGRRGLPHRRLRADPLPADDGERPRGPAADGAADDQQVLHRRPRPGPQHRRALRLGRPAGLHDVVAQPRRAARRLGPRHLRPGDHRCDGRRAAGHRRGEGGAPGVLLRRDHHLDAAGAPRGDRRPGPGGRAQPRRHGAGLAEGRHGHRRSWTRSR